MSEQAFSDETKISDLTVADLKVIIRLVLAESMQVSNPATPVSVIEDTPAEKKMSLDELMNDLEG